MDRWCTQFEHGQIAEADKTWNKILKECANREDISEVIENLNGRSLFAEDKKKINTEKVYLHLLVSTEKTLGKEHRFVGDICRFMARYADYRRDYKSELTYRLRDLNIHEKALGKDNRHAIEARFELGHLFMKMKDYAQAEPYLKRAVVDGERNRRYEVASKAKKDYLELLHATGGDTTGWGETAANTKEQSEKSAAQIQKLRDQLKRLKSETNKLNR